MPRYGITVYEETTIMRSIVLIVEAETEEASKASAQERIDEGRTLDDLRARFPHQEYNVSESESSLYLGDKIVLMPEESDPNQMPLFGA